MISPYFENYDEANAVLRQIAREDVERFLETSSQHLLEDTDNRIFIGSGEDLVAVLFESNYKEYPSHG
jgi:hypothetical protein